MIHEQPGLGVKWPLDKTRNLAVSNEIAGANEVGSQFSFAPAT